MNIIINITPAGYFQATPNSLGLTLQEAVDVERGELPMDRFEMMLNNVRYAMAQLSEITPQGNC